MPGHSFPRAEFFHFFQLTVNDRPLLIKQSIVAKLGKAINGRERMLLDEQEVFDNGVGIPTKIFESAMPPIAVRAEQVFAMQLRNLTGKRTTFSGAFCVYADSDSKTNPFLSLREMYS